MAGTSRLLPRSGNVRLIVALLAFVTISLVMIASRGAAVSYASSESAFAAATAYVRTASGSDCQVIATSSGPPPSEDSVALNAMASLAGRAGWLRQGRSFVGSGSEAAAALGGSVLALHELEMWVATTDESAAPKAVQLIEVARSDEGLQIWVLAMTVTAAPASVCENEG
jgi:hypothetical protein